MRRRDLDAGTVALTRDIAALPPEMRDARVKTLIEIACKLKPLKDTSRAAMVIALEKALAKLVK